MQSSTPYGFIKSYPVGSDCTHDGRAEHRRSADQRDRRATLGDKKFFVQHIVEPHRLEAPLRERLNRVQPDVVVFGHTHKPFCETVNGILFLNPGSVTRPRGQHPPSLVRLTIESDELKPQFIEL